jgi:phosphoenolpyruvate synthase/pyruvate phosphate dikinase
MISVNIKSNNIYNKRTIQSIDNINIGAKEHVIKVNKTCFGTEVISYENLTKKCSLTEAEALKLKEIGLKIQSSFSSVRDIEWEIENNIRISD